MTGLLETLARDTWNRIHDGHELNVYQGETTITDCLLLEILRFGSPLLRVFKTTPASEATWGTDWEWWVGQPGRWLRYAVQAKRIVLPGERYDTLGKKVGAESQLNVLDRYASGGRAIPIYCFYNFADRLDYTDYWHCDGPIDAPQLGCSITPAAVVRTALSNRGCRSFSYVHRQESTYPWRCLLRCPPFVAPLQAKSSSRSGIDLTPLTTIFGTPIRLYQGLPEALMTRDRFDRTLTLPVAALDPEYYNHDLRLYPHRIAVFDLRENPGAG